MKRNQASLIWGVLMVVFGAMMLMDRLGLIGGMGGLIWAVLFGAAGAAFVYVYVRDSQRWWAIIPGFTLLGLGVLIGLEVVAPRLADVVGAPVFLASIGASFWAVYLTRRHFWWAIIPGGVMLSVAAIVILDAFNPPFDTGAVMLLGLGATFATVALTGRGQTDERRWALIPAGILGMIGFLILADSVLSLKFLWPLFIVAVGAYFVVRGLGKDKVAPAAASPTAGQSEPSTQKLDNVWPEE